MSEILRLSGGAEIVASGGWSKRRTLYGGDQFAAREDSLLDPAHDAAKIRAFFVHPNWARRGIGGIILQACENAALAAGFTRLEMGATLSGVAFYQSNGYAAVEKQSVPLSNGEFLPIVKDDQKLASINLRNPSRHVRCISSLSRCQSRNQRLGSAQISAILPAASGRL